MVEGKFGFKSFSIIARNIAPNGTIYFDISLTPIAAMISRRVGKVCIECAIF